MDVWLASAKDVEMSEIGWGNQSGFTNCKEYEERLVEQSRSGIGRSIGAEECPSWSARQVQYREQLRHLFVRHWELAPDVSVETFASDAYRGVLAYSNHRERQFFTKLEPHGGPSIPDLGSNKNVSDFVIFVRWSDFPPAHSLSLSRIYVAVEVFNGDGSYSSTAPARKGGDPATFNQLELERPHVSRLSPCEYPLEHADAHGEDHQAWCFLEAKDLPSDTFILANEAAGYRYDPEGLSPIPIWRHYFSKTLGKDEVVCGPDLRYVAGKKTFESEDFIDMAHISVRHLPDGAHLLKMGTHNGNILAVRFGHVWIVCDRGDLRLSFEPYDRHYAGIRNEVPH